MLQIDLMLRKLYCLYSDPFLFIFTVFHFITVLLCNKKRFMYSIHSTRQVTKWSVILCFYVSWWDKIFLNFNCKLWRVPWGQRLVYMMFLYAKRLKVTKLLWFWETRTNISAREHICVKSTFNFQKCCCWFRFHYWYYW